MTRSSILAMRQHSIAPRTIKYAKGYGFLSFAKNYKKQLLDTRRYSLKTASKKVVHKAGEFLRNKIADTVTKSSDDKIVKQEPVEETKKERKNLNELRQVLKKWNLIKYLNY